MSILSMSILLFFVLDPLGNVPIFLSVLKDVPHRKRTKIIIRELLIGLVVLLIFLFAGPRILNLLGVSHGSMSIAGGVVLFIIALKMIFPSSQNMFGDSPDGEPFIVPLAIPLIAGPSALATLSLMAARTPGETTTLLVALLLAWSVSLIIMLLAKKLHTIIGERTLIAMERLMGMILTAIAVEMLITGVKIAFFNTGTGG
jgi:MarC family membrane protein